MLAAIEDPSVLNSASVPACLPPWRENPYRLVTFGHLMRIFKAHDLLGAVRSVNSIASLCFQGNRSDSTAYRLAQLDNFIEALERCQQLCEDLDLPMSALLSKQFAGQIATYKSKFTDRETERMAAQVSQSVENELSLRAFFAISPDKTKLYSDAVEPFGAAVAVAFPSISFDAGEANRCYALGRNTACVFHLMRVMEIGLAAAAARFSVSAAHANWETIINQIEKGVSGIEKDPNRSPDWKDEREFYSQCVSHFRVVKDAWRNYTAHARGKYDEQEAFDMLGNVRAFMQKLSTRLHE